MNTLIWIAAGAVLALSFALGFWLKKLRWVFLPVLLSLPASFGVWIFSIQSPQMAKAGLGIIALGPVVLIIIAVVNLAASLIGAMAGVIIGKIRR